jgi:hypothetical protein
MFSIFRALLGLYPAAYRDEFTEEMLNVLYQVQAEWQSKGLLARAAFLVRESAGLFSGALHENTRAILGSFGHSKFPSRRLTMRSEFRFPKATVTLMALILAGILLAMDRAKAIQASVSSAASPVVGPVRSADFSLFLPLLLALGLAGLAGAIGWVILFALHRSGIHRLSQVDPTSAQPPTRK